MRILHAKFHCNRLTAVQGIQDYASLIFLGHSVYLLSASLYVSKRGAY